ncbi:MAG: toxin HicA [Burkholderiales bacterium]|nr:toxin HicA [Betaproteobacteria bacterium]MBK9607803.1 toxin HicA [Betaproteobacteria bacterium]MBP8295521.1 toxin HicA [Burkholderiales bacterium]
MASIGKILEQMRSEPTNVRFSDLMKVCAASFGKPRQTGTSHAIFKTPWPADPRVNIQDDKGKAKAYQVRQVLLAIDKLKEIERER